MKHEYKIAIITVGYNRKDSLSRLLISICNADYTCCDTTIDLVISLDYSDKQSEIVQMAGQIEWEYGKKIIKAYSERQGLRQHILNCGDLTSEYDAVVVLEDDIIVSNCFMNYVLQSIEYAEGNTRISGISLYSHRTNPGCGRPFEPLFNGYDIYLMQYAQSWGQCWTSQMWQRFREWYNNNKELKMDYRVPRYVIEWNDKSWLKYYIYYTAINDLYFIYPYFSLTTNNSEIGEHRNEYSTAYQVPMVEVAFQYRFPTFNDAIKYDAFFERMFESLQIEKNTKVMLDLYGLRENYTEANMLVSTRNLPYEIMNRIALKYRPHEANLIRMESGEGIFIYDLRKPAKEMKTKRMPQISYDIKAIRWKQTLTHGLHGLKLSILNKLRIR